MKRLLTILIGFIWVTNTAQKLDYTASFRHMDGENYFRINYDNDYFAAADENYTQGYSLELVMPWLEKNPINYVLPNLKNSQIKYGLAVEHMGFTPEDIVTSSVIPDDRPFASAIMLKSFKINIDTINRLRLVSGLSVGMMGPFAFGDQMQTGIHRAIGDRIPFGWRNQIQNDFVLNYEVGVEKQLLSLGNVFTLQANSTVKLGTLFTNANVGVNAAFGIFNNSFRNTDSKRKFQIYAYGQPLINFIGYDATLQGGIFNKSSVNTVSSNDLERITTQFKFGIVVKIKGLFLEYSQARISKEFSYGEKAGWGGVKVGWLF